MSTRNVTEDKILNGLIDSINSKLTHYDVLVDNCYRISHVFTGKGRVPRKEDASTEEKSFVKDLECILHYLTVINSDLEQSVFDMDELV